MPQLENGYTRIADEILEKVASTKLNGTQLRIILIVWRCTYGWQKKEHKISENFLAKATGIHKHQIKRELKGLIDKEILLVMKEATFKSSRILAFNKHFNNQVAKKQPPSEKATSPGSEKATTPGSELATQKKDINKQYIEIIDAWNKLNISKLRSIENNRKKLLNARLKEHGKKSIYECIESIKQSSFLKGQNSRGWIITFDWLIKPNNYIKVLEGNYKDKKENKKTDNTVNIDF